MACLGFDKLYSASTTNPPATTLVFLPLGVIKPKVDTYCSQPQQSLKHAYPFCEREALTSAL